MVVTYISYIISRENKDCKSRHGAVPHWTQWYRCYRETIVIVVCIDKIALTQWSRDKMAAISQTMSSSAFFLNENIWILIRISLKSFSEGSINIMAWHRPGDKPSSESMMVRLVTQMCVTRPQWVKHIMHHLKIYMLGKTNIKRPCFSKIVFP